MIGQDTIFSADGTGLGHSMKCRKLSKLFKKRAFERNQMSEMNRSEGEWGGNTVSPAMAVDVAEPCSWFKAALAQRRTVRCRRHIGICLQEWYFQSW